MPIAILQIFIGSKHYSYQFYRKTNMPSNNIYTIENPICPFCDKICKNKNSFSNHKTLCPANPNRKIPWNKDLVGGENQYTNAKKLGINPPLLSKETRTKLSTAAKISNLNRDPNINKENGIKISKTVNEKVANGTWHTSLAKYMHYDYNGIDLHGSWELAYAKYLDANNIKWLRCKNSFTYSFEDKIRKYTPDFYLIESDEYVEIKGYKTPKDDAKWNQFPNHLKLTVLMETDLKVLGII